MKKDDQQNLNWVQQWTEEIPTMKKAWCLKPTCTAELPHHSVIAKRVLHYKSCRDSSFLKTFIHFLSWNYEPPFQDRQVEWSSSSDVVLLLNEFFRLSRQVLRKASVNSGCNREPHQHLLLTHFTRPHMVQLCNSLWINNLKKFKFKIKCT